jgi:hypothetical protein
MSQKAAGDDPTRQQAIAELRRVLLAALGDDNTILSLIDESRGCAWARDPAAKPTLTLEV